MFPTHDKVNIVSQKTQSLLALRFLLFLLKDQPICPIKLKASKPT